MENKSKFQTPRFSRANNNLSQNKNIEQEMFMRELNAYTDVRHLKNKHTPLHMFTDESVDNNLISSIYDTPKAKINESLIDNRKHRFQKYLSKNTKSKHNKTQQNAFCERLSTPKIKKKVIDPQFEYKPPNNTNVIFEYNKDFINSQFNEVDEIITLSQLESILIDFSIIDHSVKEKPYISENIFPLCQINETKDCSTFDSKKLKEALIQSFNKSSECAYWREISNCIKSARMNRKKKSSFVSSSLQKKSIKISKPPQKEKKELSDDKGLVGNQNTEKLQSSKSSSSVDSQELENIHSNENSNIDNQILEKDQSNPINEEKVEYKFKLITDHFSDIMIDLQPNSEASNSKADEEINIQQTLPQEFNCEECKNENLNDEKQSENIGEPSEQANNEDQVFLEKDQKEGNSIEDDYNTDSGDQYYDKNIGIDDLIKEIENNPYDQGLKTNENSSSCKEIFDFNSYYSLEFESGNENKTDAPTNSKNDCPDFSKLYNSLSLTNNENKEANHSIQTKINTD